MVGQQKVAVTQIWTGVAAAAMQNTKHYTITVVPLGCTSGVMSKYMQKLMWDA